jgi:hypothetical protein
MKYILFYGNCQISGLHLILNLNPLEYYITVIECFSTNVTEIEMYNCIKQSDIIIMQSIHDNYRDKTYLSTKYILNQCKPTCNIIIFDNCYFDFYYFDTTIKPLNDSILWEPCLYHYTSLVECYKNNISADEYIEQYINNYYYKNKDQLEDLANASIIELRSRYDKMLQYKYEYPNYNIHCISIADYIQQNYKDKLLFYSVNHPTKDVLQYICENIIQHLNISNSINYNLDPLNYIRCILFKCISSNVNFDINNHFPFLLNHTDINEIVSIYYNSYKNSNIFI